MADKSTNKCCDYCGAVRTARAFPHRPECPVPGWMVEAGFDKEAIIPSPTLFPESAGGTRQAPSNSYYHVAPASTREQIMNEGLQAHDPQAATQSPWPQHRKMFPNQPFGNYVFQNHDDARQYAAILRDKTPRDQRNPNEAWDIWHVNPPRGAVIHSDPETRIVGRDPSIQPSNLWEGLGTYKQKQEQVQTQYPELPRSYVNQEVRDSFGSYPSRWYIPQHVPPQNLSLHQTLNSEDIPEYAYEVWDQGPQFPKPIDQIPRRRKSKLAGKENEHAYLSLLVGILSELITGAADQGLTIHELLPMFHEVMEQTFEMIEQETGDTFTEEEKDRLLTNALTLLGHQDAISGEGPSVIDNTGNFTNLPPGLGDKIPSWGAPFNEENYFNPSAGDRHRFNHVTAADDEPQDDGSWLPSVLYHWTEARNAPEINNQGLVGGTYLTTASDPEEEWNPDIPDMINPLRVTVDTSQLVPEYFGYDATTGEGFTGRPERTLEASGNVYYTEDIPPEAIIAMDKFKAPDGWNVEDIDPQSKGYEPTD